MQGLRRRRFMSLEAGVVVGREEDSMEGAGEAGGAEVEEDEQEPGICVLRNLSEDFLGM